MAQSTQNHQCFGVCELPVGAEHLGPSALVRLMRSIGVCELPGGTEHPEPSMLLRLVRLCGEMCSVRWRVISLQEVPGGWILPHKKCGPPVCASPARAVGVRCESCGVFFVAVLCAYVVVVMRLLGLWSLLVDFLLLHALLC